METRFAWIRWYRDLGLEDLNSVGGKNASLGEMIRHLHQSGVRVPDGFATTAEAYAYFLAFNQLTHPIQETLATLNVTEISELTRVGGMIRAWILAALFPPDLETEIRQAYADLIASDQSQPENSVAVRSSATSEDLPEASFAGQQETLLNVCGIDAVLSAIREVFASLFNDRAISYRTHQGFQAAPLALSAGIQRMVHSAVSGVLFTLDTESGFDKVILVTSTYGLGEILVQGAVNPDEFYLHKAALRAGRPAVLSRRLGQKQLSMRYAPPGDKKRVLTTAVPEALQQRFSLTDAELEELGQVALKIADHYGRPMDIEWAKAQDGTLFMLQARPETVQGRASSRRLVRYVLAHRSEVLCEGRAIGQRIGSGKICVVRDASEMDKVTPGSVLVTDMTDPDWEPVMRRAAAIVTNRGGRTCHAAIIARELGIPAVVGCEIATQVLRSGQSVTVSCSEGEVGFVYAGIVPFEIREISLETMPDLPIQITLNVADPSRAFDFQRLPCHGVGLARIEFVISRMVGIHPNACLNFETEAPLIRERIVQQIRGYADPVTFYVQKIIEAVATLAAAFEGRPVIVRFSDFKSNEYANLIGGQRYELQEENPMLGFRGARRYLSPKFAQAFALECQAIRYVREQMGFENVWVMIPFVRSLAEARDVLQKMEQEGLVRGRHGLRIMMMCELPTNCVLAEAYLEYFDGFSIGSNDLTQLTLGLDRDSGLMAEYFDERDPAVKYLLSRAIRACRAANKYVGICGQGPSDHQDFARWLMQEGILSLSLNPDAVLETWLALAEPEQ